VSRTVEPHGLVVKNGTWYLVARPAGTSVMRVYRVGNVGRLRVLDESFARDPGFELGAFWRERLAEFDRERLTGTATIRLSPELADRLPDIGDRELLRAAEGVRPDADGWRTVALPIESPDHAAGRLVPYGAQVEVLAPAELRTALVRLAADVLDRYRPITPAAGTAASADRAAAGTGPAAAGSPSSGTPAPGAGNRRRPAAPGGRRPAR